MNKRALCFSIMAVHVFSLYGQNREKDSVLEVIRTAKHDTTLAAGYMALTAIVLRSNPDTVIPLCEKTLALVEKNWAGANAREKHAFLVAKADAINNTGVISQMRGQTDKALANYQKSLALFREAGAETDVAVTLNNLAAISYNKGLTDQALQYYTESLATRKKLGDKAGVAQSLSNMGVIYVNQGMTAMALDYLHQSLKIREEIGDKNGAAFSLNNLGGLSNSLGQYDNALDYYQQSMAIYRTVNNKEGIANVLHNIGNVYDKQNLLDKALKNYELSADLYKSIGSQIGIGNSLHSLAGIYAKNKETERALEKYKEALAIFTQIEDKRGIAMSLSNMGVLLLKKGMDTEAADMANHALQVSEKSGYTEITRNTQLLLSRIDSSRGDMAGAFAHYKRYLIAKDSLTNEGARKAALKKQFQFEFDKKASLAKAELEHQEDIHQEALKRERLVYWSAFGALGLILLSVSLLFNRSRLKEKHKYQEQLNRQQKEQAVAVMEIQEQERKRIAEDLHDSLGHLLSTTKINLQMLPESQQKQLGNSLQLLNQASEEIRTITFNLMPRALEEGGLVSALYELADKVTHTGAVKVILHISGMDELILEKQSQFSIYRVVQEAVNNILKHAQAKEISIQLSIQDGQLSLLIEDDGKGFDTRTKIGGRGLGNIRTRLSWLRGKLAIDSTPGMGTTITAAIPI
jgi:two-component system NarL family sensor kinase